MIDSLDSKHVKSLFHQIEHAKSETIFKCDDRFRSYDKFKWRVGNGVDFVKGRSFDGEGCVYKGLTPIV